MLHRRLYALSAILRAWWLAVRPPGDGLPDREVYALQGVDRFSTGPEFHRTGRRRWRSLARWAQHLRQWWPARLVTGDTWRKRVRSLLLGFVAAAGEGGEVGVRSLALDRHVACGALR